MTMTENAQGCPSFYISLDSTKSHITVCGRVIARDFTFTPLLLVLSFVNSQSEKVHHSIRLQRLDKTFHFSSALQMKICIEI